jgi:SAM-dependent methyltransferase
MTALLYEAWDYSEWGAHEIVRQTIGTGKSVLDVGCATGNLAVRVMEAGGHAVGIEPNPDAAALARTRGVEVLAGSFDEATITFLSGRRFDFVVFADSLEHMADPATALFLARRLIELDGRAIISLPNAAVWHARARVGLGRFEYTDGGIFDRTHLRFFTLRTARKLVRAAGYSMEQLWTTRVALPFGPAVVRRGWEYVYGRLAPRAPQLLAEQFVMLLRPEPDARLSPWP